MPVHNNNTHTFLCRLHSFPTFFFLFSLFLFFLFFGDFIGVHVKWTAGKHFNCKCKQFYLINFFWCRLKNTNFLSRIFHSRGCLCESEWVYILKANQELVVSTYTLNLKCTTRRRRHLVFRFQFSFDRSMPFTLWARIVFIAVWTFFRRVNITFFFSLSFAHFEIMAVLFLSWKINFSLSTCSDKSSISTQIQIVMCVVATQTQHVQHSHTHTHS